MVDARACPGELRFGGVLAVVHHEREVDHTIGHMAGYVPALTLAAAAMGCDLAEAEHILVEFGRGLHVLNLQRNVDDFARHAVSPRLMVDRFAMLFTPAADRAPSKRSHSAGFRRQRTASLLRCHDSRWSI